MIKLEVANYCQSCSQFEAAVKKPYILSSDNGEILQMDTIVMCEHQFRCERTVEFLEKQIKKDI